MSRSRPQRADIVIVRDDDSGCAHVAQVLHGASRKPSFIGLLTTADIGELKALMREVSYRDYAQYETGSGFTTIWFGFDDIVEAGQTTAGVLNNDCRR